jgi:hypothetical protein
MFIKLKMTIATLIKVRQIKKWNISEEEEKIARLLLNLKQKVKHHNLFRERKMVKLVKKKKQLLQSNLKGSCQFPSPTSLHNIIIFPQTIPITRTITKNLRILPHFPQLKTSRGKKNKEKIILIIPPTH